MKIWVTGAAGMLGQEVSGVLRGAERADYIIFGSDREIDITNRDAVHTAWDEHGPFDWVVNCAAWTAVDTAEEHEAEAERLNVDGPRTLAKAAADTGAALVHISTDYVFSGEANRPYRPDDLADPRSAYGRTKRDGEDAVKRALARHLIIRTAWLYGAGGKNFVYTMLRLMNEREEIGVVADQYGLPTYAPDLAAAIVAAIRDDTGGWGTYHYTNAPGPGEERRGISWYDFARAIYERGRREGVITSECRINALSTAEYPTPAARPAYSVLDSQDIVATFSVSQPEWPVSLERFLSIVKDRSKDKER